MSKNLTRRAFMRAVLSVAALAPLVVSSSAALLPQRRTRIVRIQVPVMRSAAFRFCEEDEAVPVDAQFDYVEVLVPQTGDEDEDRIAMHEAIDGVRGEVYAEWAVAT